MQCYVICSVEGWYPNFKNVRVRPRRPASQSAKQCSLKSCGSTQMMESADSLEMLVHIYRNTWHHLQKNVGLLSNATATRNIDLNTITIL